MSDRITEFFNDYVRKNAAGDFDALVELYSDPFMSADPNGSRAISKSDLRAVLPKRKQLLQSIGCKSTSLVSIEQTALDERYVLVKANWRWEFESGEMTLASSTIIRTSDMKIVFYLNHDELMTALRNRGLLPANDH